MYAAWIKIDETLPWIELKGEYHTRRSAKKMTEQILKDARVKIVMVQKIQSPIKVCATARTRR